MEDPRDISWLDGDWVRLADVESAIGRATEDLEKEVERLEARVLQLEPQEGDQFFSLHNVEEALATAVAPFEREIGRYQSRFRELYDLLQPGGTTLELATNRRLASRICRKEGAIVGVSKG